MLLRLGLPTLGGGDNEQASVDGTDARQHVANETNMAGDIDERQLPARGQRRPGEPKVDGETPRLFHSKAVRVGAGEGEDQRRFAVVDMAGSGDDVHAQPAEAA